jgi:hypothetical protein
MQQHRLGRKHDRQTLVSEQSIRRGHSPGDFRDLRPDRRDCGQRAQTTIERSAQPRQFEKHQRRSRHNQTKRGAYDEPAIARGQMRQPGDEAHCLIRSRPRAASSHETWSAEAQAIEDGASAIFSIGALMRSPSRIDGESKCHAWRTARTSAEPIGRRLAEASAASVAARDLEASLLDEAAPLVTGVATLELVGTARRAVEDAARTVGHPNTQRHASVLN